jgi:hypothetical protein
MNKKTIKRHTQIILVSVICLTLITIGTSYSIFFSIKTNSTNQTITTGTLSVTYGSGSTTITNDDLTPTSDTDGLASTAKSLIYVQNTGTYASTYTLTVSYDYASFTGRSDYNAADMLVPLDYIRLAIYEYNPDTQAMTQIGDVMDLADLPVYSVDTSNQYNNKYSVLFGTLGTSSTGNSTATYAVKMWLSEGASECISGYYMYLRMDVNSGVQASKIDYTINGHVLDSSSANVSGATVSLLNGSKTATTATDGTFTWTGVQEGNYLVKVTTSDSTKYTGTLRIQEGTTAGVSAYATSHTAQTGNTLASLAYTYATTMRRVKTANSIATDTLNTTLTVGNSYTIPASYVLTGSTSSTLGTLTINLGTNNNISSFSLS